MYIATIFPAQTDYFHCYTTVTEMLHQGMESDIDHHALESHEMLYIVDADIYIHKYRKSLQLGALHVDILKSMKGMDQVKMCNDTLQ